VNEDKQIKLKKISVVEFTSCMTSFFRWKVVVEVEVKVVYLQEWIFFIFLIIILCIILFLFILRSAVKPSHGSGHGIS
jgi:hypothetical protein